MAEHKTSPSPEDQATDSPLENESQPAEENDSIIPEEQAYIDPRDIEISELKDQVLRTAAELENFRKRSQAELKKAQEYSIEFFAKDMVEVLDNLYRAADTITDEDIQTHATLSATKEGVEITKKSMLAALERYKVTRIFPLHEKFDHNLHQAVTQLVDNEKEAGTVIDVIQPGYVIGDRLLRPAMVAVSKREQTAAAEDTPE